MTITRRDFLSGGACLIGCAILAGCLDRKTTLDSIAARLGDSPAAAEIGRAYLMTQPDEKTADALAAVIEQVGDWPAIEERIRSDYRDGRVVTIEGWPLSVTEARIYAWVAIRPR